MIKYIKCRDVKTPKRGHSDDAAIDFFMPEEFGTVLIRPGESIQIGSGIKMVLPVGHCMTFLNKSSRGSDGLIVGAQLVDENYRGEVGLNVWNVSNKEILIFRGEKLVQGLIQKYENPEFIEITPEEFEVYKTVRGDGGFGSTGL